MLTPLDLLAGGAVLVLAVLAWVSLALAHLAVHSGLLAVALTALVLVPVVLLARRVGRPRVRADRAGVLVALGCAAVAAALTLPGFGYGVADKDPGGYVSHAFAIASTGDYSFVDPVLETARQDPTFPVQLTSPGARFAGVWVRPGTESLIVPQFYHLWPALLATAHDLGGQGLLLASVPLPGLVSVLILCALLRRVGDALLGRTGGLVAAGAGGLLLATNMLQVWQARYPTTEVMAQALFVGALLAVVVALQTGWRPAAGLGGLLVGVGWLNRADGLLLVLLSVGAASALIATRRWDSRATWFAGGLGLVAPHALLQAYDLARNYTLVNKIPPLPRVTAVVVGCLVLALVLNRLPFHRLVGLVQDRRVQVGVGLLVVGVAGALVLLGFLRPRLFGADFIDYNGREIRSYDEQILRRLSWFFSLPGFAVMLLGVGVVALNRWRAAAWAAVLPSLALFAVYGYTASNSTRMMWWTRRYVPTVLPGVMILLALAIAFFVVWRFRGRLLTAVPAVLVLVGLTGYYLSQSVPLRSHDEWAGSFDVSQELADLSGGEGVYLWEPGQACCAAVTQLFATPVWLQRGQLSALLWSDAAMRQGQSRDEQIARYVDRFEGRPVFVVGDGGQLPDGIDPSTVVPVYDRRVPLPMWEESDISRPDEARTITAHVSVWRVR